VKEWYDSSTPLLRASVLTLLLLLVMGSAVGVTYLKHREVQLYITLQGLKNRYEKALEEQGRLRLEEAAWGNLAKIEDRARVELQMHYPQKRQRLVVR
jgi:cell division protein FtsL